MEHGFKEQQRQIFIVNRIVIIISGLVMIVMFANAIKLEETFLRHGYLLSGTVDLIFWILCLRFHLKFKRAMREEQKQDNP